MFSNNISTCLSHVNCDLIGYWIEARPIVIKITIFCKKITCTQTLQRQEYNKVTENKLYSSLFKMSSKYSLYLKLSVALILCVLVIKYKWLIYEDMFCWCSLVQ